MKDLSNLAKIKNIKLLSNKLMTTHIIMITDKKDKKRIYKNIMTINSKTMYKSRKTL